LRSPRARPRSAPGSFGGATPAARGSGAFRGKSKARDWPLPPSAHQLSSSQNRALAPTETATAARAPRLDTEDQPLKPRQAQDEPSKVEPLNKQSRDPLEPRAKAGRRTRVDEAEVLGLKALERIDRQGLGQRHAHRTTAVGLELCGALRAQTVRDHAEQAHTTG